MSPSAFPWQRNPLDDLWTHSPGGAAVARYFLKVVPTSYEFLDGRKVLTNQFSLTQFFKGIDYAATARLELRRNGIGLVSSDTFTKFHSSKL